MDVMLVPAAFLGGKLTLVMLAIKAMSLINLKIALTLGLVGWATVIAKLATVAKLAKLKKKVLIKVKGKKNGLMLSHLLGIDGMDMEGGSIMGPDYSEADEDFTEDLGSDVSGGSSGSGISGGISGGSDISGGISGGSDISGGISGGSDISGGITGSSSSSSSAGSLSGEQTNGYMGGIPHQVYGLPMMVYSNRNGYMELNQPTEVPIQISSGSSSQVSQTHGGLDLSNTVSSTVNGIENQPHNSQVVFGAPYDLQENQQLDSDHLVLGGSNKVVHTIPNQNPYAFQPSYVYPYYSVEQRTNVPAPQPLYSFYQKKENVKAPKKPEIKPKQTISKFTPINVEDLEPDDPDFDEDY